MAMSLMRILRDGPVVSLNGSPTVSPTTEAVGFAPRAAVYPLFNVLLRIVPSAPGVRHHNGQEHARHGGACEHPPEGVFAQYPPDEDRQDDGKGTRNDHLAQGRASTDGDAVCVIGLCLALHQSRNLAKL